MGGAPGPEGEALAGARLRGEQGAIGQGEEPAIEQFAHFDAAAWISLAGRGGGQRQ